MQVVMGFLGIITLLSIAVLMSNNRRAINKRTVILAFAIQAGFGAFVILPHDIGQQPKLGNHLLTHELYRDELVCLVRTHHPILTQTWDQEKYLSSKHIHVRDNELGTPVFDKTLSKSGLHRDIAVQVPDFHAASSFCSQSDLIFTTTSNWADFAVKHKPLVKITMPCSSSPVAYSLIWHQRSEVDPAHQWLKEQIIETAKQLKS